ncbi:SDR family NAD(P)-dependent oxidoreductase [Pseudomonas sp. S31]|uniref:SDR family NAD(P)-dependent oxidoreductase n=1 Tax=Pseudomonas sp. S31 TaxID=1564473 RepID=UPI0019128D26|nr:SDR family NAD(P)-dependent oxidoreductase [Pseudomonas sp. S31]MBK4999118.1 SDR family NAD(P)-dependent oxidoreductase [Pseudomonas sp. S31]
MHLSLNGKRAVVCGSTSGVGLAIVIALADAGAEVVVNGRCQERVDAALRAVRERLPRARIIGIAADLDDAQGLRTLIERVPHTDILVDTLGLGVPLWRDYAVGMAERRWGRVVLRAGGERLAAAGVSVHPLPWGAADAVAAQVVALARSEVG